MSILYDSKKKLHLLELYTSETMIYPPVICYIAIENGPVEIVDCPIKNMVDLSSSLFLCLPEGKNIHPSEVPLSQGARGRSGSIAVRSI